MSKDRLNIIIPVFNPRAGWRNNFIDSLQILENELKETDFMVILVNDGSTIPINNIEEIVNRFGYMKYYSYPVNMGKGHAIRYGITRSEADYYIYTDADFPFGYEIILQTYKLLKSSGTNIVIGTRDGSYSRMLPFERRIVSVLLKEVNYFITGFRIRDTQAGLKGLDNKAKKILAATKTNSFIFELEFLKKSLRQGLSYKMINVKIRPGIHFTDFRFQVILKEAVSFFKLIFKIGEKDTSDF